MKNAFILLVALFIRTGSKPSTDRIISGYVYDRRDRQPIDSAKVLVEGTSLFTLTDRKGHYIIHIPTGKIQLIVSDTSTIGKTTFYYQTSKRNVLKGNLANFYLTQTMRITEDVVEYNIAAFHSNERSTIKDILKHIPTISFDTDGSIICQGKPLYSVWINGKKRNGGNISLTLKSVKPNDINKIQIVDDYGDSANLCCIKDPGPEKVMNIITRRDPGKQVLHYLK